MPRNIPDWLTETPEEDLISADDIARIVADAKKSGREPELYAYQISMHD